MMPISFDATITHDLDQAESREWLEANGLGGWASGTIAGCHTRRYHGLLIAACPAPLGRIVAVGADRDMAAHVASSTRAVRRRGSGLDRRRVHARTRNAYSYPC